MMATTMLGAGTGLGGNCLVIDDPHKTREEPGSKEVEAVRAYGETFATRHDDKKQGVTVIVMQRINDNDLSAHVPTTEEENYLHLKIEAKRRSAG